MTFSAMRIISLKKIVKKELFHVLYFHLQENILPNSSFNGIYANTRALNGINSIGNSTINRTSLMSTGSSEEGTSSGSASSGESSHISSSNDQGIEVSSCTNSTNGK